MTDLVAVLEKRIAALKRASELVTELHQIYDTLALEDKAVFRQEVAEMFGVAMPAASKRVYCRDAVVEFLRGRDRPVRCCDIARRTGLNLGSVRSVIYQRNPELFRRTADGVLLANALEIIVGAGT